MTPRLRRSRPVLASATATVALLLAAPATAPAATYPVGFSERTVFSGLTNPTAVRFASDGRVFVAEKSGLVKVFDSLTDSSRRLRRPADAGAQLLGPRPARAGAATRTSRPRPYVYVLYTHDAAIGGTAPRWGTAGRDLRRLPDARPARPPTAASSAAGCRGCTAAGNAMAGREQVLIEDWCQQYPSHSIGTLAFGADGALYVSGGDGASFNFVDYGQDGSPLNPCGDPPGGVGAR